MAVDESATLTVLIDNNNISNTSSDGMELANAISPDALNATLNATITNNIVTEPAVSASNGINVQSGSLGTDTNATCAGITGNTVSGAITTHVVVRNTSAGSTFSLPGYAGLGTDTTAVANFIKANNTVTTVTALRKTSIPANQFSGGPACATPAP